MIQFLIKIYYSIIGWYRCIFIFNPNNEDEIITSNVLYNNKSNVVNGYKYLGNKTFYKTMQAMEPTTGVVFFKSEKITLKYWEVGILNLKN